MYTLIDTDRYWFTQPLRYSPGAAKWHIWDNLRGQFLCDDRMQASLSAPCAEAAEALCKRCLTYARQAGIHLEEQE